MAKVSVLDKYPNMVRSGCVVSLTAGDMAPPTKISSQYNPKDMLAMLIQRIEYNFDETKMNLDAVLDQIEFGLCLVNVQPSSGFNNNSNGLLDFNTIGTQYGTLVGGFGLKSSLVKDFTSLRGGGLICHPASLYTWNTNRSAANLAGAMWIYVQIYYVLEEITPQDWQEMWQLGYINTSI